MKLKFYSLFICLLFIQSIAKADCTTPVTNFPWTEGFEEETFAPDCWQVFNVDEAGTTWSRNTTSTHIKTGSASAS